MSGTEWELPYCQILGSGPFLSQCIYAPNRNPDRDTFTSCADLVDLAVPTVLCGDFNAVFDRALDCWGVAAGSLYHNNSSALALLFCTCCVVDNWRYLHPDSISFLRMCPDGAHASRIDILGCPVSWISGVSTCDLLVCPYSDHSTVYTELVIPSCTPRSPGHWGLNVTLYHDEAFATKIQSFWVSWRLQMGFFPTLQAWWDWVRYSARKKKTEISSYSLLVALASHLRKL